ncbi:hypothetical protein [Virgibacillus sp. CBA3643]|uniref:hypothetical protein n=1 Tax=Virgibacillus sp. CBA3643 TaxID=2942278 RepID=UPI0035A3C782
MNDRKLEVLNNGKWVSKEFSQVEIGERFRLFEENGERVYSMRGSKQWIAAKEPYQNSKGEWAIEADVDTEVPEENYH